MDWIKAAQEEERKLRAQYQKTAEAMLAPKKVMVRWQDPAVGTSGSTSVTKGGTIVIDIAPHQSADQVYGVFLHELGHALDGGQVPSDYHKLEPNSQARNVWSTGIKAREDRAEAIAEKLAHIADAGAPSYVKYDEPVVFARLKALEAAGNQREDVKFVGWVNEQIRLADQFQAGLAKRGKTS